jgi:regulator of protease activity HflC (stomatin/prohibitin superfamily)
METLIVASAISAIIFLLSPFSTIQQGHVGVMTVFGRYRGVLLPGFNWVAPWIKVTKISIQNHAAELEFQAITLDQANVYFGCTLIFSIEGSHEESVRKAHFSFASEKDLLTSINRLLEDETRTYVATKRQAEMIGISQDVVYQIKDNLASKIANWGYTIHDLRYNNITFDEVVNNSMARVVAAVNERDAAENEGEALLIRKVKEAEANGAFIKINAEAEKLAWKLKGQGLSDFRQEVAKGIHIAVDELQHAGVDPNYMLFFMYTETLKYIAEHSKAGQTIFVNHNPTSPQEIMEEMSAFYRVQPNQVESLVK